MATPISKNNPVWLSKQDENDLTINKHYRRSIRYYKRLYRAWPDWCAEHPEFKEIYAECKRRRDAGEDVHVDHIVPISSDIVSGLHVPWNLQVISAEENYQKSNKWWPDCPYEITDLFNGENYDRKDSRNWTQCNLFAQARNFGIGICDNRDETKRGALHNLFETEGISAQGLLPGIT